MKNLKKLLSGVLVITLLAGSAVSASCFACPRRFTQPKHVVVRVENPQNGESNKKAAPGDRIAKLNPYLGKEIDEMFKNLSNNADTEYACDEAFTALNKLEKDMLKSAKQSGQKEIKEIKESIDLLRQAVNFRKARLHGSFSNKVKKVVRDEMHSIKNKVENTLLFIIRYTIKIGAIGLLSFIVWEIMSNVLCGIEFSTIKEAILLKVAPGLGVIGAGVGLLKAAYKKASSFICSKFCG